MADEESTDIQDDGGLPVLKKSKPTSAPADDGLPVLKKKEQASPSDSPTGGEDLNNGSQNSPVSNPITKAGLGYIPKPDFQDSLMLGWKNEEDRKKNMQDTLHGYIASGNSDPATALSLAKTVNKPVESPNAVNWLFNSESAGKIADYVTNHIFIPAYKSVVGGVNTVGAAAVDFLYDSYQKANPNSTLAIFNKAGLGVKPVKDYFDEAATGASNLAPVGPTNGEDGVFGKFLDDLSSAGGTVALASVFPQSLVGAGAAEVPALSNATLATSPLVQAGAQSVGTRVAMKAATAPITRLFAVQGAASKYNESSIAGGTLGENLSAGAQGAAEGAEEGLKMEAQMAVGNFYGEKLANKLAEKGLLIGGKPTQALINATMAGTVFGGTSAAADIANGNPIDYDAAVRQGVLGIAFGVPEIAGEIKKVRGNKATNEDIARVGLMTKNLQDLNQQAIINNLMGFQPTEIDAINKSNKSSDDLYAESLEAGAQAYEEKDPDQKKALQQQQLSLKNQGDVKRATETIIKNPDEFLDGVLQSALPVENKIDLMNKATVINKGFNPIELHKEEIQNQINDLNSQVQLIDAQQQATPQDGESKAKAFTLKDKLVQEREVLALNLLDVTDKQAKGIGAATAVNEIEARRQAELEKVGPLPHNVVENTAEGTHDVVSNGDIVSQHPTADEAHQRAEDLNRPQIKKVNEINDKYNRQRAPFDQAAERGLMEPPTGKKVTDQIPEPPQPEKVFNLNTPEGKITVEPISENELLITDPSDGSQQKYSVKEAVDAFDIKPEDIKKIADNYVESEKSLSENDGKITNDGTVASNSNAIRAEEPSTAGEIPSETAAQQNEEPIVNKETTTEGIGENSPIEDNAAQSGPPAETTNTTDNGEIKTNEAQGRQEGVLKEEQAQEPTPEPVKASGEELDVPALKDSGYSLAATEIPSGKNKGKFGIFETGSGKLISNLYDTHEELITNFEKNKDRLTPDAIKSKIAVQNITEGIRSLKVKNRAYESTLGLPVYAWNNTLELIARSIEGGAKLVEAIRHGVNHIKQNYTVKASDKEIEDAVRNALLQKPTRNEGENMHSYARRVLDWKKAINSSEELSSAYKKEATKSAAPETRFNNQVKSGVELLRKNLSLPIEEFNKSLGVPEKDTEHYIAAIKQLIDSDSIKKINAEKIMQSLREQNPKKVFATEASLLKRSLREREQAASQGYRQAKAETKQAFLEYDAARKTETAEKIAELKEKHDAALEKEKQARADQKEKLTSTYKNIRAQIHDILTGLNKSKLLAGVDYNSRELISFANKLNGVVTEKGIDKFRDFVNKVIDHADYAKDISGSRSAIAEAKRLSKQDYVPQNIKSLLKDITSLNPERVEDPKELRGILENVNESLSKGTVPENSEADLVNYINRQRDFDTQLRRSDILDKHQNITSQDEFQSHAQTGNTNFVHKDTLADITNKIIKDDNTTYNEKIKKLNEVDDTLDLYRKGLNDSIDENGNINNSPPNFLDTLEKVKEGTESEPTESQRDALENVAIAKQDQINPNAGDLSPEQKKSLEILQKVPLKGQDSTTLRLFNNVIENVIDNDNHSGMTILEAKAIANSDEGALKPVKYLESIGKEGIRSVKGVNKVLEKARELRSVGENISALLTRFANNDFKFLTATNTGTHFDQIQNGFTAADHRFQELVAKKVEKLFKQYPDIAKNPEAIQRLSLFSFINQYREFASPDQQDREIQKRAATINKDIALKEKGLDAEKGEAEIEKKIWGEFAEKIKEKTGIDVTDKEQLPGLKYSDIQGIDFLKEGEKKIYDTYREADDALRPEHEQVAIGINKPYETWANHMRDNYRFLGSGMVDVIGTDNLGFQATDNNVDSASDSMTQRVKGDPLAQKSGERQKVLNLNFFDGQNQSIKNILNDIHTLKDRMTFDEAMKNKEFQDAIGNENHQFYKDAVTSYVLNEMGLNKGAGEKELKLIKKGLNVITKLGTYKQLLSMTAYVKQATSTIVNTLAYTGFDAKTMYEANQVMGTPAVEELLKKHPISRRAENNANLNILSQEGIGDKNNIVSPEGKSAVAHTANAIGDFINKYFLHLEKSGITTEPFITKPIKFGDVKTAEWSWITLYGKELVDSGKYPDFKSIDWEKEAANPDREAASRAEQVTSKQLNENTKAGRSKLINSSSFGYQAAKAVLFPFGSFNMHKGQVLVENLRTLTSKDTYVNKNSFKEQGGEAIKSILSNLAEESAFQGLKIGIGLSLVPMLQKGLIYTLGSLFGTKEETEKYLDAVDLKTDKKAQTALNNWFTQTVGNQAFGALGNTPQDQAQKLINYLSKKAGGGEIFYEPKLNISQELQQAQGAGMISAAFSGNQDRMRDLYRIIDNKNKYNVPVDITPMQKSIIATSVLSDILAMAGLNDADLNRSIETMRKNVDNELASKFHDPYFTDESAPRPLTVIGKKILLSEEHQNYYEQQLETLKNKYMQGKIPEKQAAQAAAAQAKANLLKKFGYDNVVAQGKEIKKKK